MVMIIPKGFTGRGQQFTFLHSYFMISNVLYRTDTGLQYLIFTTTPRVLFHNSCEKLVLLILAY
jgi:hypothetical protein